MYSTLNRLRTYGNQAHGIAAASAVLALCLMVLAQPTSALEVTPLWSMHADMVMEAAPMTIDLDGDGDDEVLTAAYENIIVVDGNGEELWRFDTRGRYGTCPPVLECDGESPLIYAADNRGMLTCLNGAGEVVWQRDINPIFCTGPALADLTGDGTVELVLGDNSGMLSTYDALTGTPGWSTELGGEIACPAVGDMNGDGGREIVVASGAGTAFAVSATGEILWRFALGPTSEAWHTCSPVMFGSSAGDVRVMVSGGEMVYCLSADGTVLWQQATRGEIASTISVGDFDNDGRADVFLVTQLGVLYRYDEDGRIIWDIDTQGRSLASGNIIDMDGDGVMEYLLCTQQGNLLAFSNTGEIVFNYQFENRTINETAAFGDIVRDRPGLEFAITGGESGRMFCFGVEAPVNAASQWRTYRNDNRLTGAWFGLTASDEIRMTPHNLSWDHILTGGDIVFNVINPSGTTLAAEAFCVSPDGSRQAAVGSVVGRTGVLQMPASVTAPGVYRFAWSLKNAEGARVFSGERSLTLQPYANDQALAGRAVQALRGAVLALRDAVSGESFAGSGDRGFRTAMIREASEIAGEARNLAALQAAVPGSSPAFNQDVNTRTEALNARAQRGLALARVARFMPEGSSDIQIVPFEGITWENRDVNRQLPDEVTLPLSITRRAVTGERESVSIKLLNVTLDTVRVRANLATSDGGPAVTPFTIVSVPTHDNRTAWDPLVPLDDEGVTIPPLEAREIWLDADCSTTAAGTHTVRAAFNTGSSETTVSVTLNVLPFQMAGYENMRLCCWARYDDAAVADLLAHGNTVFTVGLPQATVTESGQVTIVFDDLDEFIARLEGHDAFLLMSGKPNLGVPVESQEYVTRLRDYLNQLFAHLVEHGISEDNVALYPHDEPGGHGWDTVRSYVEFGRQGLRARPGLKFYVNGGGDVAMFEAMNEVASIWCPGYYMLPEQSAVMNYLRQTGKTIWSYDCGYSYARPIGPFTKTINVAGQYRMAAVFGFHFNGTGIGYWCYNAGDSIWEPVNFEYPLVYVNEDGTPTSSRRWEAVREGMEDARVLIALREKLNDDTVSDAAKARIRHLLEVTVPGIAGQSLEEVRIGAARYALDATNNDAVVEGFRSELLDCIEALTE